MAENLTYDVVYSSEIEGIQLNVDQARSSIARRLGIENVKYSAPSHYIDSVVGVMLEAVQNYNQPLSKEKLCAWQSAFFPSGYSEGSQIEIGQYRTNDEHIVCGMFGREKKASAVPMTERKTQMLNLFLDGYEAKITSKTWATLAKYSKDTAIRDIQDLVAKNILIEDIPGAKRPSYSIVYDAEDLSQFFSEVSITEENGIPYLKAMFKGKKPVSERLLKLDAERFKKGDLPLSNLLSKYCSYIAQNN